MFLLKIMLSLKKVDKRREEKMNLKFRGLGFDAEAAEQFVNGILWVYSAVITFPLHLANYIDLEPCYPLHCTLVAPKHNIQ